MRILFLNQYFPPDPAPTGVLLHELGEYLQSKGHTVEFISARQDYRSTKKNRRRIFRELSALGSIFFQGFKTQRPDIIFSASSPPCLLVVATLLAMRHGAKSVHWLMDMYPELAVALGEIKEGFIPWAIKTLMGWAYRRAKLVVGLDDDMAARLKEYGVTAEIIPPWVLKPLIASSPITGAESEPDWTWIYSGNLGRAHEWESLLQVQALLEERRLPYRLLFQGGGPSWPLAQARAKELNLRSCDWKPYVAEAGLQSSLLRCLVLVVTQRPETQGLLWPSKLALVSTLPRAILWIGPVDGAIARKLRQLPHTGVFAPFQAVLIADWLQALHSNEGSFQPPVCDDATRQREQLLEKWDRLLNDLNK